MRSVSRISLFRTGLTAVVVSFFVSILGSFATFALDIPPIPSDSPIVDQTATLTSEQKSVLAQKIADERAASGNQIGVLIIPSLQGDILEDYSIKVARSWGIGTKDRNSGVLLLIVKNDHKVRIEVGYGLEGALTDIRSGQIIRDRMAPAFRQNDYNGGVSAGVDGIISAIHNEADPHLSQSTAATAKSPHIPWEMFLFFGFIIFSWLGSMLGRTKSWWAGGVIGGIAGIIAGLIFGFFFIGIASVVILTILGLLFDKVVSNNFATRAGRGDTPSWWAGGGFFGGGGSGSGGGFGGFGGGGFGGGGASGDW